MRLLSQPLVEPKPSARLSIAADKPPVARPRPIEESGSAENPQVRMLIAVCESGRTMSIARCFPSGRFAFDAILGRMAESDHANTAYPAEVYEIFDAFMQQVIKDTYDAGAKRAVFVALVIASGELLPLAWGRIYKSGVKEFAMGAAGVVALRVGLKYLLGGPLGMILSGFTVATLISFFWSNQKEVMRRVRPYKKFIHDAKDKFEDIQARYRDGRYDSGERALLVEGLLRRVESEIEAPLPGATDKDAKQEGEASA